MSVEKAQRAAAHISLHRRVPASRRSTRGALLERWLNHIPFALIGAGLLILYIPVFASFGRKFLINEEDSHAGILLLGIIYAYWVARRHILWSSNPGERLAGWAIIIVSLLVYVVGSYQSFLQFEILSLATIVAGLTLLIGGMAPLRRWAVPNTLLLFTAPLGGAMLDSWLVPLRLWLTGAAADFLSLAGLAVGHRGVIIVAGFIELNIAGACVGLRSMVSLFSIAILYLHLYPLKTMSLNLLFIALVPAIALFANFVRICALVLTAAHFGVSAEASIHDVAAYLEVALAIGLFVATNAALERLQPRRGR